MSVNTIEFHEFEFSGNQFQVPLIYQDIQPIGVGAFGLVCSARNTLTDKNVAIKKIVRPFSSEVLAKRAYRELKLLKELVHDNIISLNDCFLSPSEDLYITTDLLGADLHYLLSLQKFQPLEEQFVQYFLYQILRALKYVHSAGVVHRDLKPSNILVSENCDIKICDFGLARVTETQMTGYVSTRFYRAPEIMLSWQKYDEKVDIWSVGCIFAEMLLGKPLFPGKDHVHQFIIITELLGTPSDPLIESICSENTMKFIKSLPFKPKRDFKTHFIQLNPLAIDLLEKMLSFDPKIRITAEEALSHPYLEMYHDPEDEPISNTKFDWANVENDRSIEEWKSLIIQQFEKKKKS